MGRPARKALLAKVQCGTLDKMQIVGDIPAPKAKWWKRFGVTRVENSSIVHVEVLGRIVTNSTLNTISCSGFAQPAKSSYGVTSRGNPSYANG